MFANSYRAATQKNQKTDSTKKPQFLSGLKVFKNETLKKHTELRNNEEKGSHVRLC